MLATVVSARFRSEVRPPPGRSPAVWTELAVRTGPGCPETAVRVRCRAPFPGHAGPHRLPALDHLIVQPPRHKVGDRTRLVLTGRLPRPVPLAVRP